MYAQREGRLVDCKHEMRMRSRESGDAMDGDAMEMRKCGKKWRRDQDMTRDMRPMDS